MGSDGFDTELVRIEHILANSGYSLRVYQNSTFSDTLSFLLIPSDEWKRVEQHYSPGIFLNTSFRMENNLLFLRLLLQS